MIEKRIINVFSGKPHKDRPPFWLMRQAGRYLPEYRFLRQKAGSFLDLCLNPKLAAQITMQPIERFYPDAAILFSDILIVPYGLGQNVVFKEGVGPVLDAINEPIDFNRISENKSWTKIEATYEVVSKVKSELNNDVCLIGFAGAPWTVATYMVEGGASKDYSKVKTWAYRDPQTFKILIEILIEKTIEHLVAQIKAGSDVVKLFDSWAGVLNPQGFEKWVIEPTKRICSAIKKTYPEIPIIGFPRGAGVLYLDYVQRSGIDAVAIDQGVPLKWASTELQRIMPVQGNMDPITLTIGGSLLEKELERICQAFGDSKFIFNLGHGVLPHTPPENVVKLSALIKGAD